MKNLKVNIFGEKKKEPKNKQNESEIIEQPKLLSPPKSKKDTLEELIYDEILENSIVNGIALPGELFDSFATELSSKILESIKGKGYSLVHKEKEDDLEKALSAYKEFEENKSELIRKEIKRDSEYLIGLFTEIIQNSEPVTDTELSNTILKPKGNKVELYEAIKENDNRVILNPSRTFNVMNIVSTITGILLEKPIAFAFDDETFNLVGVTEYKKPSNDERQINKNDIVSIINKLDEVDLKQSKKFIIDSLKQQLGGLLPNANNTEGLPREGD